MNAADFEAKAQSLMKAIIAEYTVNGTKMDTTELENVARIWFDVAWNEGDKKSLARAESMIWSAITLGGRI